MLQEKLSLYFYLLYGGHNRGHVSRAHAMMGDSPTTARKKKKKKAEGHENIAFWRTSVATGVYEACWADLRPVFVNWV